MRQKREREIQREKIQVSPRRTQSQSYVHAIMSDFMVPLPPWSTPSKQCSRKHFFTGKERSDSSLHARSVRLSRLRLGGKDYAAHVESVTFQSYMTDGGICFYENTKCKGNPWQDDKKIVRMTESRQLGLQTRYAARVFCCPVHFEAYLFSPLPSFVSEER